MGLKVYKLQGHTYVFDEADVPDGAELVGERGEKHAVTLFPDQVDRKQGRKRRPNKAAAAPENKQPDSGDED